jgi:outer membrane protein
MIQARFRRSLISTIGLILSQAFSLNLLALNAFAQNVNGAARPALPIPMSTSTLIGLEQPPQFVIPSKAALPNAPAPSNVTGNRANNAQTQLVDLIQLYQEAAFSDPVLNAARFNYQASKELFWQGLSLLLPQANATPTGTRYYQHGASATNVSSSPGNSRVFDQKSYTVTLTQPVFNVSALEAFKQGDLNTKIADMRFYLAQQDLIIRVSQAYFDAITSQDNVELYRN